MCLWEWIWEKQKKESFYDYSNSAREGKIYLREYYREEGFVAQKSVIKVYLL